MSLLSLPIIYLTGATACGKGTIGNMLAHEYRLYHISIGDLRRGHLASIRAGVPWMSEPIRKHVTDGLAIPDELLEKYETVPAVLYYYNYRIGGGRGWSVELASFILNEEITRINILAQKEGLYKGIIIDGHPLTVGNVSERVVEMFRPAYAGITIVIESPLEVARQRYLDRARSSSGTEQKFDQRMEITDRVLPEFIELMAGYGDIVRSTNDGAMSIDDAYEALLSNLEDNNAWLTFANQS